MTAVFLIDYYFLTNEGDPLRRELERCDAMAKGVRPFATVNMSCGEVVAYETPGDFPRKDFACPCGDPEHWIVRYMKDMRQAEGWNVTHAWSVCVVKDEAKP